VNVEMNNVITALLSSYRYKSSASKEKKNNTAKYNKTHEHHLATIESEEADRAKLTLDVQAIYCLDPCVPRKKPIPALVYHLK
jgi:hypothetical protein